VGAAAAAGSLAARLDIALPICQSVAAILHRGAGIDAEIAALMARPLREEE
jgi:glycerol-3-phosphate dehydrogenase